MFRNNSFRCVAKCNNVIALLGGDLDGDLYFVCWDKDMLPRKPDFPPMNYKAPEKKKESGTINLNHMTEFISEYIKHDQLGELGKTPWRYNRPYFLSWFMISVTFIFLNHSSS